MQKYLVIGIYKDSDNQRFAESYEADDPATAEKLACEERPGLIVAGVINEEGQVVA